VQLLDVCDRKRALVTELPARSRAEEALRRNEAYLAEAQRLSRTGSFGCRISLAEMVWSEETFRIFEYDRATQPSVQAMVQRVHPQDMAHVQESLRGAMREGKELDLRCRLLLPDETVKHLHVIARAMNVEPTRVEIVGAVMDVTGQSRVATQLERVTEENKLLRVRVHAENLALREEIEQACMFEEIVGCSPALRAVLANIVKVAPTDSTVLITGETGTGKELIARAIHMRSRRATGAFVGMNCASSPSSLIASELFGHERGAFTGALQQRQGRFEVAHSGTLFLDEIGELAVETQVALLRVLQERQFERVGGNRAISTNVRVIAATNRDLPGAIASGTFRVDLFYRLNVFPIVVPPLRQRKEDIPMLVEYFVKRYADKAGKKITKIDQATMELCKAYSWPGNIRELQNVLERAVILNNGEPISVEPASLSTHATPRPSPRGLTGALETYEKQMIEAALAESAGKVSGPDGAAAKLGIPRSTLDTKLKQFRIDRFRGGKGW